jgi:hypothetical protein
MAATQSFFRNQARTHSAALQTLREIAADDFGERHLLLDQSDLDEAMSELASASQTTCRRRRWSSISPIVFWLSPRADRQWERDDRQLPSGVRHTGNRPSLLSWSEHIRFADIDPGEIIDVSMPQGFPVECRYANTFLKMLF